MIARLEEVRYHSLGMMNAMTKGENAVFWRAHGGIRRRRTNVYIEQSFRRTSRPQSWPKHVRDEEGLKLKVGVLSKDFLCCIFVCVIVFISTCWAWVIVFLLRSPWLRIRIVEGMKSLRFDVDIKKSRRSNHRVR